MTEDNKENNILSLNSVAAGMISKDLVILLPAYLLIVLAHLLSFFLNDMPSYSLLVLERICQLLFLTVITLRWVKTFKQSESKPPWKSILVYFLVGTIVWLSIIIPFLLQALGELPKELNGLSLILLIPAIYLLHKYFFYFFPILNGITPPYQIMTSSLSINKGETNLPAKTLLAPLGLFSIITASLMALSPDGRSLTVNFLINLSSGVFWFLHCYLSLAAAFLYWSDKDWHESKLDPYRKARLSSISITAPKLLVHFLRPKQGAIALAVSLLLWFANMMALEISKPAADIRLTSAVIDGENGVKLQIQLEDKEYEYRGIQPVHFALAGEQRASVCEEVTSVNTANDSTDYRFYLPETKEKLDLTIIFKCLRDNEALKKLEDLHLWYRGVKLEKIDLK